MDFETLFAKTPATIEEIRARVAYALERHPLCRNVKFDIVSVPRTAKGGNWTISLRAVASGLWRPSDWRSLRICRAAMPARLSLNYRPVVGKLTKLDPIRKTCLTRAITIIALTCFLVAGAAATSILGRDSVPAARVEMASPVVKSPVANRASKQDRLTVVTLALASFGPPRTDALSEPLRQAYASAAPADIDVPKFAAPLASPPQPAKPK